MVFSDHIRRGHPITYGSLALFSFIELIITAVLTGDTDSGTSIGDKERFLLFASVWTFVFSIFYIYAFLRAENSVLASVASHGIWLFVTWVFWLSGAAAITAALNGGLDCGGHHDFHHCNLLNASEAFAWILFIINTFAFVVVALLGYRASRNGTGWGSSLV